MIFYFSGTGNSKWVAERIAEAIQDKLFFIPDAINQQKSDKLFTGYNLAKGEKLGFIFPCYAWGIPVFIADFIRNVVINNVSYVYYICTCGDDTGMLQQEMCNLLEERGWTCHLGYDIKMPESYVNLPGFDVDPKDKETRKINFAKVRIDEAVDDIIDQRRGTFETIPGDFPKIKSGLLRTAFYRWLMTAKYFKTNENCNRCGKCVKECSFGNIKLFDGKVVWGENCVNCMRCYHSCPQHAIEWGKWTKNKGQYLKR